MIQALGIKADGKTVLLIGGGILVAYMIYRFKNRLADSLAEKSDTLQQGLTHPIDALSAFAGGIIGVQPSFEGGIKLTPNFQAYVDANGGVDAYILAHQNGTFQGAPYVPRPTLSPTWHSAGKGGYWQ